MPQPQELRSYFLRCGWTGTTSALDSLLLWLGGHEITLDIDLAGLGDVNVLPGVDDIGHSGKVFLQKCIQVSSQCVVQACSAIAYVTSNARKKQIR